MGQSVRTYLPGLLGPLLLLGAQPVHERSACPFLIHLIFCSVPTCTLQCMAAEMWSNISVASWPAKMLQAEVALEAWSLIQPSGTSAPAPALGASLPHLDRLQLSDDGFNQAISICSAPQIGTTGDVEFLSFWRALSEAQCSHGKSCSEGPVSEALETDAMLTCEGMGPDRDRLIRELEEVRDELLDRFEAGPGIPELPATVLRDVVKSIRERSVAPEFWDHLLGEICIDQGVLSVSEVTMVLLTWLRLSAVELGPLGRCKVVRWSSTCLLTRVSCL
eukprot:s357_g31.t1